MADAGFGDPLAQGQRLAAGGCRVVQLRCKGWTLSAILQVARPLQSLMAGLGGILIVNDNVEVARAVGAGGVHLGQGDGCLADARAALARGTLIGRSTHTRGELDAARQEGANYVGFGPVFRTRTKETGHEARGLVALQEAVRETSVPVIGIGGITVDRVGAVRSTGAWGWAVAGGVWGADDPDSAIALLLHPAPFSP
jgi:thiamine-phosphate diphosphorylase